jgi:hypothetical protein
LSLLKLISTFGELISEFWNWEILFEFEFVIILWVSAIKLEIFILVRVIGDIKEIFFIFKFFLFVPDGNDIII